MILGKLRGDTRADDAGDVFGSAAPAALLRPANQERTEAQPAPGEQHAHPFWPVKLVGCAARRVDPHRLQLDGDFPNRLRGITVKWHARAATDFGDLLDREDHAGL